MRKYWIVGLTVLGAVACVTEDIPTTPTIPTTGPITSPAAGSVWVVGDTTPLVGEGLVGWMVLGGGLIGDTAVVWTAAGAGRVTAQGGSGPEVVDVVVQPAIETTLLVGALASELTAGDSIALTARVLDQRGRDMSRPVTWSSTRGRVTVQGLWARAALPGADTLVAVTGPLTLRRPIFVRGAPLQVAASAANIVWGDTVTFQASPAGEPVAWRLLSSGIGGILDGSVFRPLSEPFTTTGEDAPWLAGGLVVEGCRGGTCDTARVALRRARVDPVKSQLLATGGDSVGHALSVYLEFRDSTGAIVPGRHLYGGQGVSVLSGEIVQMHRSSVLIPTAPGPYHVRRQYTEGATVVFSATHHGTAGPGRLQGDNDTRPFLLQFSGNIPPQARAAFEEGADRLNALTQGTDWGRTVLAASAGSCWPNSPEIIGRPIAMMIQVLVIPLDGVGGAGAGAKACLRRGSEVPLLGLIIFDEADLGTSFTWGQIPNIMIHEMIHAGGLDVIGPVARGMSSGTTGNDPRFIGPASVAAYLALGGSGQGVPMQNYGGPGVERSHTRDSVFRDEIMNAFGGWRIGTITGAILADLGFAISGYLPSSQLSGPPIAREPQTWYEVDLNTWKQP